MSVEGKNDENTNRSSEFMEVSAMEGKRASSSAVVFTHMGSVSKSGIDPYDIEVRDYEDFFRSYIECNSERKVVSIVYVYVDWAVKQKVEMVSEVLALDATATAHENVIIDVLKKTEEEVKKETRVPEDRRPEFIFVGMVQLLQLLIYMDEVDKTLIKLLGGKEVLTYDSPKFVEAVIRIARGKMPHLSIHPVIRIDEDVEPNSASLEALIDAYLEESKENTFFFFSGGYGTKDGETDFLNDYAVRTHWFFAPGTDPNDSRKLARIFLADLAELGATQFLDSESSYSSEMQKLLSGRPSAEKREAPQVISGAGLVMSTTAIRFLPPFMNMNHQIIWIDDHIKRRLHEAIGDIKDYALERVDKAKTKQDRYPNGVTQGWVDSSDGYFPNIARGCIFIRLISNVDGTPTEYSKLIGKIVQLCIDTDCDELSAEKLRILKDDMIEQARTRFDEVLKSWKSPEFNNFKSHEWATGLTGQQISDRCEETVQDAIDYLRLVYKWPIFVRAIDRLPFKGNRWLYWEV